MADYRKTLSGFMRTDTLDKAANAQEKNVNLWIEGYKS
jgi:hypothetical protein